MDPAPKHEQYSFWDSAPDEIIARILAFLPCSNIYLAQRVCRKWRSVILSSLFMLLFQGRSQCRRPCLVEFQWLMWNQAWAFDLDGRKWFQVNFSFLPEKAIILASSGGLVCLGRSSNEDYHLYICNPLTKKWRQIPSLRVRPSVVVLGVDHQNNTFTIAALVFEGYSRTFGSVSMFDSKTGDWKKTIGVSRELRCRQIRSGCTSDSKTGLWKETIGVPQEFPGSQIWAASSNGESLSCLTEHPKVEMFDIDDKDWFVNGRPSHLRFDTAVKEGKWGLLLPTPGMTDEWYDVVASCWSWSFPAKTISCDAGTNHELRLYSFSTNRGGYCTRRRLSVLSVPKSPLTRQKMGGRNYMEIGAVWDEYTRER